MYGPVRSFAVFSTTVYKRPVKSVHHLVCGQNVWSYNAT